MRKTINIVTILTVVVAILNILTDMSDKLGISEVTTNWIKFIGFTLVAVLNVFSNVKSGEEVKGLKQEVQSLNKM